MRRDGFSIIFVIFFMIIISTVVAISLRSVNTNYENVQNLKKLEKAKLFLDNAIELTILSISQYDRTLDCAREIHIKNEEFDAYIKIKDYLTTTGECGGTIISTEQSSGTLFLEVEVTGENLRLYKNVVQKI